jgi:hypothetical protein
MSEDRAYPPATVPASGTAIISWRTEAKQTWDIEQVTTKADNVGFSATCEIRKNGNRVSLMIPTGSTAGQPPPVRQSPSDVMDVRWTGATPGAVVEVTHVGYTIVGGQ